MDIRPSPTVTGVLHLSLDRHEDGRGFFMETFRAEWLPDAAFVQGNVSSSDKGVLRGLHYHLRQDDLWFIASGSARVGVVDLRVGSPTYLRSDTLEMDGPKALYIPSGVAHGFYAKTPTLMSYLVTNYYDGTDELGVAWNDPDVGIDWAVPSPTLSERDQDNPRWRDVPPSLRPVYRS